MYRCICVCIYVYIAIYLCICFIAQYACMYVCIHVYMYACIDGCVYIYMHVCVHMHNCTYVYVFPSVLQPWLFLVLERSAVSPGLINFIRALHHMLMAFGNDGMEFVFLFHIISLNFMEHPTA